MFNNANERIAYETAEMEIVHFESEDVIATSGNPFEGDSDEF